MRNTFADITNSEVITRIDYRQPSETFICPWCDKEFVLDGIKLTRSRLRKRAGKTGPYCSRRCAGKYSKQAIIR